MRAFCSECKCCEAQDGFDLCIFCEDGVPCPNRQRAARPAITTTPPHITPLAPKKPGHPRNPNSPWRGNAGLYLGNNAPLKPTPTNSAAQEKHAEKIPVVVEELCRPFAMDAMLDRHLSTDATATDHSSLGSQLDCSASAKSATLTLQEEASAPQQIDEVPTAGRDLQEEKKERTTMKPTDEEIPRYCAHEGCTKTLTRANESGYCTKHFYYSKKNGAAPKPCVSKPAPPRNSTSKVGAPESGAATLHVTETHLNNFLLKLSLDEKTAIVQRHLEGA
jgi:hypothetical protein